jgi:predicted metal-dependent phosphoesterase TrpH
MNGRTRLRGAMHVHSAHSYDCVTTPERIIRFAVSEGLDFVLVTDHDTLDGSRAVRAAAERLKVRLEVPMAAEYLTSHGDLIAAFVSREIVSRNLEDFVAEVRDQRGILLLPHPYDQHRELEALCRVADMVEVFNARSSEANNLAAMKLGRRLGKPTYWASDAHLSSTLSRVIVEVARRGDLRESLMAGGVRPVCALAASRSDIVLSQWIKCAKKRDFRLALALAQAGIIWCKQRLTRRILGGGNRD